MKQPAPSFERISKLGLSRRFFSGAATAVARYSAAMIPTTVMLTEPIEGTRALSTAPTPEATGPGSRAPHCEQTF